MAITLAKTVANVVARGGGVYISDDAATTWFDIGRVKQTTVEVTPIETEPDTAGRTVQLSADVVVTTVMTQTSATEFANLDLVHAVATNGVWVKLTSQFVTVVTTLTAAVTAATGFVFKNAFPTFSGQIKFDNTESGLTMIFKGRVSMDTLSELGDAGSILAFDA